MDNSQTAFSLGAWHASYEFSNLGSNYYNSSLLPVSSLLAGSNTTVESFQLGTGSTIYSTLMPLILANTSSEVLITTCFWSSSASALAVASLLRALSRKACLADPTRGDSSSRKIRVRICISSLSLWQKLFHTQSPNGYIYSTSKWPKKLKLPPPSELPGLDIKVKSIFIKPFSVMHSKYIICDGHLAILPSCNVSWEDWFEGAIILKEQVQWQRVAGNGWQRTTAPGLVTNLRNLWRGFWGRVPDSIAHASERSDALTGRRKQWQIPADLAPPVSLNQDVYAASSILLFSSNTPNLLQTPLDLPHIITFNASTQQSNCQTLLLPHPHSINPRFHPTLTTTFPFISPYSPHPSTYPSTPLTSFTLALLAAAQHSILLLTPNLTAAPVIAALKAALVRGVRVTLITNENLMVLEQWATAFTTTRRQVAHLRAWHAHASTAGDLRIGWFTPRADDTELATTGPLSMAGLQTGSEEDDLEAALGSVAVHARAHPVKLHLKCTIVDERVVLLGSGNMDRASWITSQELGVAVENGAVVRGITEALDGALRGRIRWEGRHQGDSLTA